MEVCYVSSAWQQKKGKKDFPNQEQSFKGDHKRRAHENFSLFNKQS